MAVNKKKSELSSPVKKEKIFIVICAGIFCFVFIIISFFPMTRKLEDDEYIKTLEKRISDFEERFMGMDLTREKLKQLTIQSSKVDDFINNYSRLDATISLKTNLLTERLDKIQLQIDTLKKQELPKKNIVKQKNIAVKVEKKDLQTQYHIVKKGETFYSICRMYGVSLDKLRLLNGFSVKTVIYPEQKIIIKSVAKTLNQF